LTTTPAVPSRDGHDDTEDPTRTGPTDAEPAPATGRPAIGDGVLKVAIIGGGSAQWVPRLVRDLIATPSTCEADLVLMDVDERRVGRTAAYARHAVSIAGVGMRVAATCDRAVALEGAHVVVVSISTGGFQSMRHDLEIPARFGIVQSVGDTVGPGGVSRALRNVPVIESIAHDMRELCPEAWMLNLTNPMTVLCQAATTHVGPRVIGLCHEVVLTRFVLSMLAGCSFRDVRLHVAGLNHLPIAVDVEIAGQRGMEGLGELLERAEGRRGEPLALDMVGGLGHDVVADVASPTVGTMLDSNQVKVEILRRFGALPAAGDRHVAEFFPGFLTEESGHGARWGVRITRIEDRMRWEAGYQQELDAAMRSASLDPTPSGELVAPVIDSLITGRRRHLPLDVPNVGHVPDVPEGHVVESICAVDDRGVHPGPPLRAPGPLGEQLRRVAAAQQLTLEAASSGSKEGVLAAMLADPLAGRVDFDRLVAMTDELLAATSPWLPQFA